MTADQNHLLKLLTETIMWHGRYPVPKEDSTWDKFHDEVTGEPMRLHSSSGNRNQTLADKNKFPSFENYMAIWGKFYSMFQELN